MKSRNRAGLTLLDKLIGVLAIVRASLILILFSIALSLFYEHRGFAAAAHLIKEFDEPESSRIIVSVQGPTTYEYFVAKYEFFLWLIFAMGISYIATRSRANAKHKPSNVNILVCAVEIVIVGILIFYISILLEQLHMRETEGFLSLDYDTVLRTSMGRLYLLLGGSGFLGAASFTQLVCILFSRFSRGESGELRISRD